MAGFFGLPIDPRELMDQIGALRAVDEFDLKLELLVDKTISNSLKESARAAFRSDNAQLHIDITAYGDSLDGELVIPEMADTADLTVLVAGASAHTAALMLIAALRKRKVVIITDDVAAMTAVWPSAVIEIDSQNLIAVESSLLAKRGYGVLFQNLGRWILDELPDQQLAWASCLDFVRDALMANMINSTSLINGAISLFPLIPSADMPLLLANQMQMVLRMAAVYGYKADSRLYAELAAVMLFGFVCRSVARRLDEYLPAVGWAVKTVVGYSGSVALGFMAKAYYGRVRPRLEKPADSSAAVDNAQGDETALAIARVG